MKEKYIIMHTTNLKHLQGMINNKIEEGYVIHGEGPKYGKGNYFVGMYLENK